MDKDFSIKITVRNGRLLKAIQENYESVADLARHLGRSGAAVNSLVTMKTKPLTKNGWTDLALDVASFVGKDPEYLWPEYMREIQLQRATAEINADLGEVQALTHSASPEKQIAQLDAVKQIVDGLLPREIEVLKCRFAEQMTLEDTAKKLGVSRERLRQIEAKAIRKLKWRAANKGFLKREQVTKLKYKIGDQEIYGEGIDFKLTDHARALLADEE